MAALRRPVRSAGAVVVRRQERQVRVLIVRRRRQRDWVLPKGRVKWREGSEQAARRETWEESRVRCDGARRLIDVSWRDGRRRPRHIRYWLFEPIAEEQFRPTGEVSEVAWVDPAEAGRLLAAERDRRALDAALQAAAAAPTEA
jgi:8-oxo-dGTP pyrophosphatase MutT (NUDIX family)